MAPLAMCKEIHRPQVPAKFRGNSSGRFRGFCSTKNQKKVVILCPDQIPLKTRNDKEQLPFDIRYANLL